MSEREAEGNGVSSGIAANWAEHEGIKNAIVVGLVGSGVGLCRAVAGRRRFCGQREALEERNQLGKKGFG